MGVINMKYENIDLLNDCWKTFDLSGIPNLDRVELFDKPIEYTWKDFDKSKYGTTGISLYMMFPSQSLGVIAYSEHSELKMEEPIMKLYMKYSDKMQEMYHCIVSFECGGKRAWKESENDDCDLFISDLWWCNDKD